MDYELDPTAISDWEIENKVSDQLFWSPFVDENDLQVKVENGVATLHGVVDNYNEKLAAAGAALKGGAILVKNELSVSSGPYDVIETDTTNNY